MLLPRQQKHTEIQSRTGVVYKIKCLECDYVYYRQTKRSLKTRLAEHKRSVSNNVRTSKVAKHANETGHTYDFDNARFVDTLDTETKYHQRLFLASWYSNKDTMLGTTE